MPRRGLTGAAVVDVAGRQADAHGLHAVTIAAVAAELGVRPPSLYNHVPSLQALVGAIGARAMHELAEAMSLAAAGLSGDAALLAVADTQRAYARAHPGAYAAMDRAVAARDPDALAGGRRVVDVVLAVLRGFDLEGEAAIHAARAVRSTVHGFLVLELGAGFALPTDLDASFAWTIRALGAGLRAQGSPAGRTAGDGLSGRPPSSGTAAGSPASSPRRGTPPRSR
jgi:AcrR family transcriptional regulator